MNKKAVLRLFFAGVLGLGLPSIGFSQGVLTLGSVTGRTGSPVSLNLSLSGTSSASTQTSLQFNLTYSASDFSTMTAVVGPAATAKGKSVLCSPSSGQLNCLIWGANKNTLSDGVLLVLTAVPSTASLAAVRPVGVNDVLSFDSAGNTLSGLTTVGGSVQISTTVAPTLSSLTCTPSLLGPSTSAACTVSLSSAVTSATAISIADNNASLAVPASVTVASGASQATFTATAGAFTSDSVVTVTASLNGVSRTTSISLMTVPSLSSLTCTPTSLAYGASSTCTVAFSRALSVAGSVTLAASATTTSISAAPGLVAAYGFNEASGSVLRDSSGNATNGTISGATWNTSGRYGAALSFNGSSSRVDIPAAATLNLTTGMTMEAWVRASVVPTGWRSILTKEKTGGLVYGLYGNSDTNRPSVHVSVGWEQDTRGTTQLAVNTWTHLAGTYDGTTLRMYVNGVLASSKIIGGSLPTSTGMLRIGGNTVWGEYFSGLIDEVRIYNRALSAAEIQTDMNTPVAATTGPAITVPTSISVAAGATTASFKATAGRVSVNTPVNVTATSNGVSRSATITVLPAADALTSQSLLSTSSLKSSSMQTAMVSSAKTEAVATANPTGSQSLSCLPTTIAQGSNSLCTLSLDKPVASETNIGVTASQTLGVPSSVIVPVGASSAQFEAVARTRGISDATVTATVNAQAFSTSIHVAPKSLTVFAPDRQDSVNGDPVHFQVTAFEPNNLPVQLAAADLPSGAQFDSKTGEFTWQPNALAEGTFPVRFTATSGSGATSSAQVVIDVMSGDPAIEKVIHAATRSSEGACSPGSIASIQGKSLTRSTEEALALVNGEQAPIIYTSAREIAIQCPNLPVGTPLQVQVVRGETHSNTVDLTISAAAPGLFSNNSSGTGEALTTSNAGAALGLAKQIGELTAPVQDTISLLATGFGSNVSAESLKLTLGKAAVPVQTATEELPGIWRISAAIPSSTPAGTQVPLQLIFNNGSSILTSNTVRTLIEASPIKLSAN